MAKTFDLTPPKFSTIQDEIVRLLTQNAQLEQSIKNATAKVAELTRQLEESKKREMRHYNAVKVYREEIQDLEDKLKCIRGIASLS